MLLIDLIYKKMIVHRFDNDHIIHYLSVNDFPSLMREEISFKTPEENTICGAFYYYQNFIKNELVILCHGIGGGHPSYMREIEKIAQKGYRVLAFDYTGCFASSGKNIRGLSESLNCLDTIMTYIEKDEELSKLKIHLIGHSWGGYTVSNIANYHKNIASICAISGFTSVKSLINTVLKGKHKLVAHSVYKFEKKANPKFVDSSSLDALKDLDANILLIHSKDDPMVNYDSTTKIVQESLDNPRINYLIIEGKKHNPHYSLDALNYMNEVFSTYKKLIKERKLKSFKQKKAYMDEKDFFRMTEQDDDIWKHIFDNFTR